MLNVSPCHQRVKEAIGVGVRRLMSLSLPRVPKETVSDEEDSEGSWRPQPRERKGRRQSQLMGTDSTHGRKNIKPH